jgi:exopolysaccharide biosynthesis polyprenyl glycosylphosphotransferase
MSVIPFQRRPPDPLSDLSEPDLSASKAVSSPRRRVLIVGAGSVGCALAEKLGNDPGYDVVGFVDDDTEPLSQTSWSIPILGPNSAASKIVQEYSIDEVLVAYAPSWQQELMNDIARHGLAVEVRVVPSYYEAMMSSPQIGSIGDVALLPLMIPRGKSAKIIKRAFDVMVALSGLLLLFPLTLITALAVAITSPGPVLFTQERVGYLGKRFILFKFRTMRLDAESATGPVLSAGKADQRLTPIGRWLRLVRLDEIPQLVNVLRGEMSFVGPRPERPHFVEQFSQRNPVYARRHEVRPGITGLAQLHGGYHTDARDKLRFDLFYVSHHSILLDLSILMQTLLKIFLRPDGC